MLEGMSYMIGAEIPAVFVNVMRGGPGLGNIGPEQADIKLLCHGLGHGNTRAVVLAPATSAGNARPDARRIPHRLRVPQSGDRGGGRLLGQITGKVQLPATMTRPGLPAWAVWGDAGHRHNVHTSIHLNEADLERHNEHLERKYQHMIDREQRANQFRTVDAKVLVLACNTPARMAKGAVAVLRDEGHRGRPVPPGDPVAVPDPASAAASGTRHRHRGRGGELGPAGERTAPRAVARRA